jgi:hypothetical protein
MWKTASVAERNDLVPALVVSMLRAEVFAAAALVFEHLCVEGFSAFQDFRALRRLLEKDTPQKNVANALQRALVGKIMLGKVAVSNLEDALGCAMQLKSDDPQIAILFRVVNGVNQMDSESNIAAIKKLAATTPNQAVAFGLLMMCSNGDEEVNALAHSALEKTAAALGMQIEADTFYLDAFRQKGTRDWLGERNLQRESAIRYFKAEARRDAKMTAKRLKDKGITFSGEELQLLRDYELPPSFFEELE